MRALILKKTPFAEAHEMITLYTEDLGKVRAVARSVKLAKSKLSFGLQMLYYTDVELAPGKNAFVITGVKPLSTFKHLRESMASIHYALYAAELLLKSTADEEPNPRLFEYAYSYLQHLDDAAKEQLPSSGTSSNTTAQFAAEIKHYCAAFFTFKLLDLVGYGLDFMKCASCGKPFKNFSDAGLPNQGSFPDSSAQVYFSERKSGFVCETCAGALVDASPLPSAVYDYLSINLNKTFSEQDAAVAPVSDPFLLADTFARYILERDLKAGRHIGK